MKRFSQMICLLLIAAMLFAIPAYAAEEVSPRSSSYFGSYSSYLWKTSNTQFQVWFNVKALRGMEILGASEIKVQRSSDASSWTTVWTYTKEVYPQMVAYGTGAHGNYVTYNAAPGYYYRAYVQYYAKDSSGSAYLQDYTSYIYIPSN